jgi:hypothetical protein
MSELDQPLAKGINHENFSVNNTTSGCGGCPLIYSNHPASKYHGNSKTQSTIPA